MRVLPPLLVLRGWDPDTTSERGSYTSGQWVPAANVLRVERGPLGLQPGLPTQNVVWAEAEPDSRTLTEP